MGGGEAVIVAGLGCRRGCSAADIVGAVQAAQALSGVLATTLAAPDWKRAEPGLLDAAARLGLPVAFVDRSALLAVQDRCPTRSVVAQDAVGVGSVAEGAALAASGGALLVPRLVQGGATCALAGP